MSTHQAIHLRVVHEEGLAVPLLVLNKSLDVQVEGIAAHGVGALSGQLALLKEQRQEGKQRVPEGDERSGG